MAFPTMSALIIGSSIIYILVVYLVLRFLQRQGRRRSSSS